MHFSEIKALLHKELLLEWKQKNSLAGILIYVVSTVFLCYFSFKKIIAPDTYNALFWIIILFTGISTVSKSFMQENDERLLYYYQLASPQGVILSKIIYNSGIMIFLTGIAVLAYTLLLGNQIQNPSLFLLAALLGSWGFGTMLSMVSAISAKTGNNPSILAILSFPIIIPFLDTLIGLSYNAIQGIEANQNLKFIIVLLSMNTLTAALSYLLFPYLWRD